jgi:cell division protease FtsH
MTLPEGDVLSFKKLEALDTITMTAAGRIAEELYINDVSTGAASDIQQMTRMARRMVCEWGMSEKLGMLEYGSHEEHVFLGRDINRSRDYSEETAQEIDKEVRKIVDEQYERAKELVLAHRDKVKLIVDALMEFETLEGSQVRDILEHGRMLNPPAPPPKSPQPPPLHPRTQEGDIIAPDIPPGLTGAPA